MDRKQVQREEPRPSETAGNHGEHTPQLTDSTHTKEGSADMPRVPNEPEETFQQIEHVTTYVEASDHATHVLSKCKVSLTQIAPICQSWRISTLEQYKDAISKMSVPSAYVLGSDPMAIHITTGGWIQNVFYPKKNVRVLMIGDSHGVHPAGRAALQKIEVHPIGAITKLKAFSDVAVEKKQHELSRDTPTNAQTSNGIQLAQPVPGEQLNPPVGAAAGGMKSGSASCKPPTDGSTSTNRRPPPSGGPPSGGHTSSVGSTQPGAPINTQSTSSSGAAESGGGASSTSGGATQRGGTDSTETNQTTQPDGDVMSYDPHGASKATSSAPGESTGAIALRMGVDQACSRTPPRGKIQLEGTSTAASSNAASSPSPSTAHSIGLDALCSVALGAASQRRSRLVGGTVVPPEDMKAADVPPTEATGEDGDLRRQPKRKLTRRYVRFPLFHTPCFLSWDPLFYCSSAT